jgi:phosphoglycolate phosphatase
MNLLFDLDGTLTDPGVGITRCIQHALRGLGREAPACAELERFVGPPLAGTFAELLASGDADLVARAIALYRERFGVLGLFENALYPEIPAALAALAAQGHHLWVVTSKPTVYARRIVEHFGLRDRFRAVYGSELDGRNTDKTDLIREVLDREGLHPEDTWMIGDRALDVRGGRRNRVWTAGVLWGYGSEVELRGEQPDRLLRHPAELASGLRPAEPLPRTA